jgi:hypothetical protein
MVAGVGTAYSLVICVERCDMIRLDLQILWWTGITTDLVSLSPATATLKINETNEIPLDLI